ncbi:MAG TPA: urate hydroxylase PuuD [Candidatus Binatia bacterium]|jgi:uncharacterized membrane protein|nr:urate hydroxylase PuuD [Candidatus Binatia bacterium]
METTELLQALFRWIHIFAGIVWIGHLYFFNFVNAPFEASIPDIKGKVIPELRPRALYWFRWGAAWTWVTGVLLVLLVFYHGKQMGFAEGGWSIGAIVMALLTFLAFGIYDPVAKSIKDNKQMAAVGFGLTAVVVLAYVYVGGFGYRAYVIHTGALFGTLMAANVWMRIWPAQQKIITAIKAGQPPDAALVGLAGTRSRHNTYMSVPLVWTMINQHTLAAAPASAIGGVIYLLVAVALGWGAVLLCYKKSAQIKGF